MQSAILKIIRNRIAKNKKIHRNQQGVRMNSVAMIFRIRNQPGLVDQSVEQILDHPHQYEILFLQRSIYEGDANSGQICFPGGKTENNECDYETAVRETKEQTNLTLSVQNYIGKFQKVYFVKIVKNTRIDLTVHLFLLCQQQQIQLNYEMIDYRWIPFADILQLDKMHTQLRLCSPYIVLAFSSVIAPQFSANQSDIIKAFRSVVMPAVDLGMSFPLFGLTLSFILQLLTIILQECQVDKNISDSYHVMIKKCKEYYMDFDPGLPNRQAISKRFLEQYSKIRLPSPKL